MPTTPAWTIEWADIAVTVGSLILIGVAMFVVWRLVNPILKKANRIADFILGRPKDEMGPAQPSLAERLDGQDQEIAEIRAQVTPNHGSTSKLSEDVRALLLGLAELRQQFEDHLNHK